MINNTALKKRILDLSYKHHLSHLGSCITAVDIIDDIFKVKQPDEPFILSCGHAGLALYVILEKYYEKNAEEIFKHHANIHPDRCTSCGIDCSTGSLGHGLPIAVGMALANRSKNVYCLISDGEATEGSIWEALRIKDELHLTNLKIYCNWNGWGAYNPSNKRLMHMLSSFGVIIYETIVEQYPFLKGQSAHYITLTEIDHVRYT